ncbi:transposable element Tcb2 transposase [Trichonephila clavipes]|nr:transposable element Tcb2 transposase [Trichonephila clavipes]
MLLPEVESLGSWRKAAVGQVWLKSSELLTASFHDFGDNFKLQEQLSGGSVVVVHEEPHPQMTGTLSYRPEETGGRQREKSLDTRHRQLDDRYRVLPWPEDCTVVVCLHDALYGVPLTPAHRRRRSLWCREHRNWRDNEWGRVLFTDESRFSLSSDSHRILIWRERGSRNHPSNIIERDRYGGRGVLVWGGIMLGSRTDLHIFNVGSVNETRYCNEILLPYVRLFRGAMGLQFLFMDDNAPCHRTVAAEQLFECVDIERMDWPARSPDLNPIEHVWDFLGRRLVARTLPPVTIRELRLALQDEWAAMPQQLIDTLILSMGRRCETCLAVRGDHIPY